MTLGSEVDLGHIGGKRVLSIVLLASRVHLHVVFSNLIFYSEKHTNLPEAEIFGGSLYVISGYGRCSPKEVIHRKL